MSLTQEQLDRIEATPYEDMVSALAKPGADILADMTQSKFNALAYTFDHVLMETENLDLAKKVIIYNKDQDTAIEGMEGEHDSLETLTPQKAHLLHMAMGVVGEAGELARAIGDHGFLDKDLDMENLVEELGDLEFYLEGIRGALGINRDEVLRQNKLKLLGKRYASGKYSDDQAINRADKVEEA